MLVAVDAHYGTTDARVAAVYFSTWLDSAPLSEVVRVVAGAATEPYAPGEFYRRELPCLLAALAAPPAPMECIVVDGYVWLAGGKPGLGARLHAELAVPVVGVAKTPFQGAPSVPVVRGTSARPLHVTAVGIAVEEAAAHVKAMHGPFRLPTLLKRADQLARGR